MPLPFRMIVVVSLLASALASAGPLDKPKAADARAHLEKGNKFYGVRDFDQAINEYKAGALAEPTPIFDYNLGQCYRQLGKYEDAIWHYERFISRAQPTGEIRDAVKNFIEQMKAELEKRAKTQPPTEAAPSTASSAAPTAPTASDASDTSLRVTSSAQPSRSPDWFGIGLVGVGSVGVIVGGGFLWSASSLRDDADKTAGQAERDALYEKADTRTLVGAIVGGVGVAALASGVIKLVVGRGNAKGSTAPFALDVGVTTSGMLVFGRF